MLVPSITQLHALLKVQDVPPIPVVDRPMALAMEEKTPVRLWPAKPFESRYPR